MSDTPDKKLEKLEDMSEIVEVCRDFYRGSINVMNTDYLPVWVGESEEAYNARVESTAFPNLYAPIVSSLAGMITKKEPVVEGFDDFNLDDVDLQGTSLIGFIKQTTVSSIVAGIEFIAVQSRKESNEVYFKRYNYENLMSYVIDKDVVIQIVFKEILEQREGQFGIEELERYVVFKVGGGEIWYDSGEGGMIVQDDWENDLKQIPVVGIMTGKELSKFEVVPKLYDIAMLNKVSLNFESKLANVLSVVGNPVPVIYGQHNDEGLRIGVRDAITFTDKQKEGFEYVEITGGGVSKLQEKIESVNETIDKLSFSLLQKNDSRTVVDAQETQSKNTSFLTDVAVELETKINRLYQFAAEMSNAVLSSTAKIVFKKDFDDVLFSDTQLKLLHELVSAGDLSRETFWEKLKIANILPKDFDASEENDKIAGEGGLFPEQQNK